MGDNIRVERWEVRLAGPFAVLREGEPFKFRIRQQALLMIRLAAHQPKAIDRAETATLLWPGASRANALSYLRRAVMELRSHGIAVAATRDSLSLEENAFEWGREPDSMESSTVLEGIDHPIADEIRRIVSERRHLDPSSTLSPSLPATRAHSWLAATLLRNEPELVVGLVAREGRYLIHDRPPGEALELFDQILAASSERGRARNEVLILAGRACMFLTHYGRAERYYDEALRQARLDGDEYIESKVLSDCAFQRMEVRDWVAALDMGTEALRIAERSGERRAIHGAHHNLAGIKWHMLDLEGGAEHYRLAAETIDIEMSREVIQANHAYIWAVFGVPFEIPSERPVSAFREAGHGGMNESYLHFSLHLGFGELREAAMWAARLLELMADEDKERYICIAFDCAAIVLGRMAQRPAAAAVVRLGSRLRWSLGHRRSPAEALAIRRHVGGGLLTPEACRVLATLDDEDPSRSARRVADRLRSAALA